MKELLSMVIMLCGGMVFIIGLWWRVSMCVIEKQIPAENEKITAQVSLFDDKNTDKNTTKWLGMLSIEATNSKDFYDICHEAPKLIREGYKEIKK